MGQTVSSTASFYDKELSVIDLSKQSLLHVPNQVLDASWVLKLNLNGNDLAHLPSLIRK